MGVPADIYERRQWEKFIRQLAAGTPPKEEIQCDYCGGMADKRDHWCSTCYRPLTAPGQKEVAEQQRERAQRVRISHAIRQGIQNPDSWTWTTKGTVTKTARESKRAKDHYKRARQFDFVSCVDRYTKDVWYREDCRQNGLTLRPRRESDIASRYDGASLLA